MCVSGRLKCGLIRWTGKYDNISFRIKTPFLLASHGVNGHFYADDCQIYLPIANVDETKTKVLALLCDIKTWIRTQKLRLNESKMEIMLIKSNFRTNVLMSLATWMLKPLHLPLLIPYKILASVLTLN